MPQALKRQLGGFDATTVGIGSMIGAGVFVVFAPAAAAAGPLLPIAVVLAAIVAYANAAASAQLAAIHPVSGGTYIYGRRQLGEWPGFLAGWCFLTGKLASCAAMALTFGLYAAPEVAKPAGVAAVVALTVVNLLGVTRTALMTRIIVSLVVPVLGFVVVAAFAQPGEGGTTPDSPGTGVFQAAALMFFAFAGYARIATMGEEVREPARNIPRAIFGALGFTLALYLFLAFGLLHAVGAERLAASTAPLAEVFANGNFAAGEAVPLLAVAIAAALASLGALLALISGIARTSLAMAREGDLPRIFSLVSRRRATPFVSELAIAAVVITLLLTTDVLTVVGFSSFGVLLYYAVTNLSALTLSSRPWYAPRALNMLGLAGCLLLAFTLPVQSVVTMLVILAVGLLGRAAVVLARRRRG
ncbi:amino acid permease [Arthrobacter sp. JZ12]|uniref:APC family permease n=1 Tax=Arthrobacter sp. JZ12 TaxID=2654190 RepID=UPI002B497846|nr:APC family permease [Arthrobacter sp. JZ12]WRH24852.1 amino acid permease [Arthrobacter sp. JZ12]